MSKKTPRRRPKWFFSLFRQRLLIILLLLIQFAFIFYAVISTSLFSEVVSYALTALSLLVAIKIVISDSHGGAYKLIWVFIILALPLFGGLLYLLFRWDVSNVRVRRYFSRTEERSRSFYPETSEDIFSAIDEKYPEQTAPSRYLWQSGRFPIYTDTSCIFFSPGERWREDMIRELRSAERYIFLEYFIIEEGVFWDEVLEILKKKAAEGVDVRIIYDDMGCFLTLPKKYPKKLAEFGIRTVVFNKFTPIISGLQNNRDHRKILSIDGSTAYTGGANIADEYINAYEKHGHWKDCAIKLSGGGAWSLTLMFLQIWETCTNEHTEISDFKPQLLETEKKELGFVQPYADSPLDSENVGENTYLQIIQSAKKYLYISTPYLIIDDKMISALILAAKSGVDVRIITPEVYDKWFVHMTTRSYYRELLSGGVRIYEYRGGFNHAKVFLADGKVATVGTANMDFRSLYLQFECGVRLVGCPCIDDIGRDFDETFKKCSPISKDDCRANFFVRLFQDVLRLFAPMM